MPDISCRNSTLNLLATSNFPGRLLYSSSKFLPISIFEMAIWSLPDEVQVLVTSYMCGWLCWAIKSPRKWYQPFVCILSFSLNKELSLIDDLMIKVPWSLPAMVGFCPKLHWRLLFNISWNMVMSKAPSRTSVQVSKCPFLCGLFYCGPRSPFCFVFKCVGWVDGMGSQV